jgi:hypothetical protein
MEPGGADCHTITPPAPIVKICPLVPEPDGVCIDPMFERVYVPVVVVDTMSVVATVPTLSTDLGILAYFVK